MEEEAFDEGIDVDTYESTYMQGGIDDEEMPYSRPQGRGRGGRGRGGRNRNDEENDFGHMRGQRRKRDEGT